MKARLVCSAFLFLGVIASGAQTGLPRQNQDDRDTQDRSSRVRAIDETDSRAEQEAERLVSLPPEKIILLLQQEPGLFLEVKKKIVRKAFAQGRVLDPKELTDEAIFRLVRDDEETRALITQEIVERGYIRAKPTREELAREFQEEQRVERANARRNEQPYSEQVQEGEGSNEANQYGPFENRQQNAPLNPNLPQQQNIQPSAPQTPLNNDQRRS